MRPALETVGPASGRSVIRFPLERAVDLLDVEIDDMFVYAATLDQDDCDGPVGDDDSTIVDRDSAIVDSDSTIVYRDDLDGEVEEIEVSVERAEAIEGLPAAATSDVEPSDLVAVARTTESASSGSVIGWAFCRVDSPVEVDECVRRLRFEGAYVWGLFVDPSFRERGIGTALVRAVTAVAARDRYQAAFALVESSNQRSQRVFERAGYRIVDATTRASVRGRRVTANRLLEARTYRTAESTE